jgi:radical SAM superfamily enzyme YgiQ (UPF0313 family)
MINYQHPLYRPPAEANSVILQVTLGCSYNQCSFCSMYKDKKYHLRDLSELFLEIDTLKSAYPDTRKVFLADGDVMGVDTNYLLELLLYLDNAFTKLRQVSVYATAQNLLAKSEAELSSLKEHKLSLVYFGIESGNETVLKKIHKGVSADDMIEALNRASKADIKTSVTVILGVGGMNYTKEHIADTAKLINQTTVTYLSTLQLGLEENIKEKFIKNFDNDFTQLSDEEVLDEQYRFIELIKPTNRVIFRSNHASNALALEGTLPKDSQRLLSEIKRAQTIGESALIPKRFRGF